MTFHPCDKRQRQVPILILFDKVVPIHSLPGRLSKWPSAHCFCWGEYCLCIYLSLSLCSSLLFLINFDAYALCCTGTDTPRVQVHCLRVSTPHTSHSNVPSLVILISLIRRVARGRCCYTWIDIMVSGILITFHPCDTHPLRVLHLKWFNKLRYES